MFTDFSTNTYIFNATDDKTWQFMEANKHYREIMTKISSKVYFTQLIAMYGSGLIMSIKFVLSDVNNYLFYFIIMERLAKLEKSVTASINGGKLEAIEDWLRYHHSSIKYTYL